MDESIFTEEQIEELNNISQLSEEEQKKALPNFLKKLSQEQLNHLKQTQSVQQCPYCLIAENKIQAKKIYEDNELIAALEINPVNPGHSIIFPKKHFQVLAQILDVSHLFNIVNKVSALLFDVLGAQGTNVLVSNGQVAGQVIPHVVINIIPRYKGDNLNLNLPIKKIKEEELNKILSKIKEKSEEFLSKDIEEKNLKIEPKKKEEPPKFKKERRTP